MESSPSLLIVYHSQSGTTERLAQAIEEGACRVPRVKVVCMKAADVTAYDFEACRCIVLCSPEYFGYMAGAIKDLFDRTYEKVRDKVSGKSYSVVISAGNDGTGALTSIERIIAGYKLKKIQEPIIWKGELNDNILETCARLGQTLAAGIELGIY